jgi:hypothetical protein
MRVPLAGLMMLCLPLPMAAQDAENERPVGRVPAPRQALGAPFPLQVVFTNIPGHATAQVPGLPGVEFQPGTGTTHFDRPFGAETNGNWVLSALTNRPVAIDEVVLVNGALGLSEGDPAAWAPGETVGPIDTHLAINDAGDWAFVTNTEGGVTTADEYAVRTTGPLLSAAAREGDPVPGLPGAAWGATLESVSLTTAGTAGVCGDGLTGTAAGQNEVIWLNGTVLAQSGVTVPAGQIGTETWENFGVEDFWVSPDGNTWMAQGDLSGATATDAIVAVNGTVRVQEGVVLPGSGFVEPVDLAGIVGSHLDGGGHWFVRGNNDVTEQDWVYRDGAVIARRGDLIHTGATESWSDAEFADCFFTHSGNSRGDFVIGGVTDGPTASNGVIVLNNERVVVREGDPIDLNGNGLPDDDLFFNTFGNDDTLLTRTGFLFTTATMRNGAGTVVGQGFFRFDLTEYVPVELTGFAIE